MKILAIDTSCDETAAAVTDNDIILSNITYSQILMHKQFGGVVPDIARRNHEEHIDEVVKKALKSARTTIDQIDAIAVTFGPGLAIALGVGINKARELAAQHKKPLVPVNHMEGHIYSCFAKNAKGKPEKNIVFPCLAVLVSGGHTELVYMKDHCSYQVIGKKRDDAAGEALDKAARIILNEHIYPGGPVIEELALKGDENYLKLPIPMLHSKDLDFSYSGIKTALLYAVQEMGDDTRIEHMSDLAASFQKTVFTSIDVKLRAALSQYRVSSILVGGGVGANTYMRNMLRRTARQSNIPIYFPYTKKLYGDNAAMIGVAAYFKGMNAQVKDLDSVQRSARAELS
jgi:N6-L-threonylcarbamoyladenine synthase